MDEIIEYKENSIKKIKLLNIWLIFITLIILTMIFLFNNIYYQKYLKKNGIIKEKDIINIIVTRDELNIIVNNDNLIIKNKKFAYNILKINEPYTYNNSLIYNVLIKVNLDDKNNVINNEFDFEIPYEKETILKYIYKKIGGKR